jgi:hypothetical protein
MEAGLKGFKVMGFKKMKSLIPPRLIGVVLFGKGLLIDRSMRLKV